MYWLPDGTSGPRPTDGQVFYVYDGQQNVKSIWQWDDLKQQWYDITTNQPLKPPPYVIMKIAPGKHPFLHLPQSIMDLDNLDIKLGYGEDLICECGKDKHGFAKHSTWCKKYFLES
jgi:hypothetical protein